MRGSSLTFSVTAALIASVAAAPLQAQDPPVPPPGALGFFGSIDAVTAEFRPAVGSTTGVGSRGWGVGLEFAATLFGYLIGGADVGFASVADDSSFTQSTTGGQLESSVMMFYGSLYAGIKMRDFSLARSSRYRLTLGALAGRGGWSGSRSISSCVDCIVEDLPIEGGTFVEPFLIIGRREGNLFNGMRIAVRSYQSTESGVDNVISIGFAGVRGR